MHHNFGDAWYLLRCRENHWQKILESLKNVGLNTCCPLILERRRRSDKKNASRLKNSPAFPGYIFVKFDPSQIHTTAIKRIPGAMDFVRFGNRIATINQREIEAMKMVQCQQQDDYLPMQNNIFPSELIQTINNINTASTATARIDLMFSLLNNPALPRSRNAN